MRVTVRLFARLREAAGSDQIDCEVRPEASAEEVWRWIAARHPRLEPFGGSISCAINAAFAPMTATVHDGDEVAFLPPVSGGAGEGRGIPNP